LNGGGGRHSAEELLPADAPAFEKLDVAVADAAAEVKDAPLVKLLGTLSEVGDQPQMRVLCAGVIAAGWWRGDRRLAAAGVRMLAAHTLATAAKSFVKARVDRTRPWLLAEEGRYETGTQGIKRGDHSSFPSGHTAGALAVARAFGRAYPRHALAANTAAVAIALVQIPRCTHYPSDIGAGALVGLAAEWIVSRVLPMEPPRALQAPPG
jgi:membrane-associated phospholipid phosphatase